MDLLEANEKRLTNALAELNALYYIASCLLMLNEASMIILFCSYCWLIGSSINVSTIISTSMVLMAGILGNQFPVII
ncbi:hypothetical protein BELL_1098g00010 [Botrytis elliptica]|uniref:Uncharacterized protein n=1 Tax=Botrytis elliptica TaxID=278938 RepID=A0A4Z1INA7_9HELO|nr:hypothetical protein BELL_1098g00010 [Botrytis elliptica]